MITSSLLIAAAAVIVAGCAAALALNAATAMREMRGRCEFLQSRIDALCREVELMASISARTGRRVQRVENDYSDVAERVDVVESRGPAATGSLDQAIEWARRGADTDKLREQFGLTSGEAELVARLHGHKRTA